MNYKLSKHAIDVMSSRNVKIEWVEFVLELAHYFSTIKDNEDRCLKVVLNPSTWIVITAYFDRNMRKKGCK